MLVVEDGPTLTHGEMPYGAGVVAANRYGAASAGRSASLCGRLHSRRRSRSSRTCGRVLPAMGYSERQRHELEETIKRVPCDLVLVATPIDLARTIKHRQAQRAGELRGGGDRQARDHRRMLEEFTHDAQAGSLAGAGR